MSSDDESGTEDKRAKTSPSKLTAEQRKRLLDAQSRQSDEGEFLRQGQAQRQKEQATSDDKTVRESTRVSTEMVARWELIWVASVAVVYAVVVGVGLALLNPTASNFPVFLVAPAYILIVTAMLALARYRSLLRET